MKNPAEASATGKTDAAQRPPATRMAAANARPPAAQPAKKSQLAVRVASAGAANPSATATTRAAAPNAAATAAAKAIGLPSVVALRATSSEIMVWPWAHRRAAR
jgi:hypothetical protein